MEVLRKPVHLPVQGGAETLNLQALSKCEGQAVAMHLGTLGKDTCRSSSGTPQAFVRFFPVTGRLLSVGLGDASKARQAVILKWIAQLQTLR